ncbi:MAG TPA: SulP family inorganic anion transporter, partial [Anseongella sp.]|nr:SulP family inorganic anion transporter [Anseongella sp.]
MKNSGLTFKYFKNDFPAGLVVFLVALPLCLGIALASGAPLFAGIITGIVGGVIVGALNKSELSVSGPAAGLTVIVLSAITSLGYGAFLYSVVIAGVLQILFGFAKAGIVGDFFPSSVIRGMLAAIGLILILGQLPVFLGFDTGSLKEQGLSLAGGITSGQFDLLREYLNPAALGIGLLSLGIMIAWEKASFAQRGAFRFIPAALVAVVFAIVGNLLVSTGLPSQALGAAYLVSIPAVLGESTQSAFMLPDLSQWNNPQVYVTAITLAVIASLETLLSVEAVDKMDPLKRESPRNQVLKT